MKNTDYIIEELSQKLAKSFIDELLKQTEEKGYKSVYELIFKDYGGVVETTLKIDFNKCKREAREIINNEKSND